MKRIFWKLSIILKLIPIYIFVAFPAFIFAMIAKIFVHDLWLIYEDGNYARDNGYWFYKYVKDNYPKQKTIFVISKKSPDYNKIKVLGKSCQPKTFAHWFYYILCSKEISTHPHDKPTLYVRKFQWSNKTYFLQHGITRDYTGYTADNMIFKLFVTAATKECEFIKECYGHPEGVVQLLGFARFDNLFNSNVNNKQILIMPTWRGYLEKVSDEEFVTSDYFVNWNSVLNNKQLLDLLEKEDKYIVFYPHKSMQKFISNFEVDSSRVKIADIKNYDVQTLLKESALLITDYSSVFFDFAYMFKPVIWYHFDEEQYFKGHHKKGYFSEDDGILGTKVTSEKELISLISKNINNNFKLSNEKIEGTKGFFKYFDNKNCERIYNAIKGIK